MNWNFIGFILESIGEIFLGIMIIIVHRHVIKEHKIDDDVLKQMKREQIIGLISIILVTVGFLLQLLYRI